MVCNKKKRKKIRSRSFKNRKKDLFHEIPIDENKFIIFNSPLEYYISPNENKNNRTILCMELKDAS